MTNKHAPKHAPTVAPKPDGRHYNPPGHEDFNTQTLYRALLQMLTQGDHTTGDMPVMVQVIDSAPMPLGAIGSDGKTITLYG